MDGLSRRRLSQADTPSSRDARVGLSPKGHVRRAVLTGLVGSAFAAGCPGSNGAGPSPSPTPRVPNPLPAGVPNGTAFANLALVQDLAQRARPGAVLGQIDARRADLNGRATSLWTYVYYFAEAGGRFYDGWRAWADGHLEYIRGEPVTIPVEVGNLSGFLDVDTDRGVVAALSAGGQACIDRAPNNGWYHTIQYSYLFGEATLRITLFASGGASASDVYLNPTDGSVKARFVSCPT